MLIFRQLFDQHSSTYTYLLGDSISRECLLIDPVFEQVMRDCAMIKEMDLKLVATVETHVHADHVTGAWLLQNRFASEIVVSANSGVKGAGYYVSHGDVVLFGERKLNVLDTPGHTNGCITLVLDDRSKVFTGDCLLIRGTGRTDFQEGSSEIMFQSIHNYIFTLPDSCLIYPGHDYRGLTVTSVLEEKLFNPRLGGEVNLQDFSGYMANLKLSHPKQIDRAVPANLRCGQPDDYDAIPKIQDWGDLTYSFSGIWEIQPAALEELLSQVQILDVRELNEFEGPLGRIPDAKSIPLNQLVSRFEELDFNIPIVAVCRSGARSAQAVMHLKRLGFTKLANLSGGMLRWNVGGHPVLGNPDRTDFRR
ncbi:MAG: MBL fold metallo-hydrolase [Proteobacteria bacterium]|nr:MBL fold metallo-hydrolase [Pseudomonadota bacterium]MDA0861228.1 MBL fold metallo-hydrolase [Pseudomonadota bacterium]MDA1030426.1 MBL fold metallo-hydrolase [Pseudomonadota bacterium]